jgi:hypothetical protein
VSRNTASPPIVADRLTAAPVAAASSASGRRGDRAEATLRRHLCTQFQQARPETVTDTLAPARCDMEIAYK